MLLNSLQVVEVLADDSNFRQTAMERLAGPLAQALSLPPADFASAWLAGICPINIAKATDFKSASSDFSCPMFK